MYFTNTKKNRAILWGKGLLGHVLYWLCAGVGSPDTTPFLLHSSRREGFPTCPYGRVLAGGRSRTGSLEGPFLLLLDLCQAPGIALPGTGVNLSWRQVSQASKHDESSVSPTGPFPIHLTSAFGALVSVSTMWNIHLGEFLKSSQSILKYMIRGPTSLKIRLAKAKKLG